MKQTDAWVLVEKLLIGGLRIVECLREGSFTPRGKVSVSSERVLIPLG